LQNERQNGAKARRRSARNTVFEGTNGVAPASPQKLNAPFAKQCENNAKNA
jgi:hypothetical protein